MRSLSSTSLLRNRPLMAVSLAVAVSFTGVGMVLPVRVLYAQSRGASLAIIGAMASSFLLSNFIFQYPTGWLSDFFGRRRMMVIGLAAQALVSLLWLVVTDPILFVAIRFLEGVFAASVLPAARALVADTVSEERRGEAYGIFGSGLNAGFLFGPALGGLFAVFGYNSAFIGSCLFRLAALVLVLALVPARGRVLAEVRARARAVPQRALFTLPLIGTYLLCFGDSLYFGFDLTLMPLWMRNHLGASVAVIGLAYAAWAVPNIVGGPFGGRLADRRRRSTLIFVFGLAQVPIYFSYGLLTSLLPIFALWIVHGAIYSLLQPAVDATLAKSSPTDARARAQSVYSTVGLASAFISANVLSALYGINFRLPLFVMAAGFGLCVLIGGTFIRISERRPTVTAVTIHEAAAQ
ncbi:MAG: MFS transporter [Chloroflexota bacterium]